MKKVATFRNPIFSLPSYKILLQILFWFYSLPDFLFIYFIGNRFLLELKNLNN